MVQQLKNTTNIFRIIEEEQPILARYGQAVLSSLPTAEMQEEINICSYLVPLPNASFVMRVQGDAMVEANIPHHALLVVERQLKPVNNMIVVAMVDGEIMVKRYIKNSSGIRLMPANQKYKPIPITEAIDFKILGVVTKIIIDAIPV